MTNALARAGLPTSGKVKLFHATSAQPAAEIQKSGRMRGDSNQQVWLASTTEIAALHHAAGAADSANAAADDVDAVMRVEVLVDDLYDDRDKGDTGDNGPASRALEFAVSVEISARFGGAISVMRRIRVAI